MDEQIKSFLESREWLKQKGRFYETPMGDRNNYITISKESVGTYRDVKVKLMINVNNSWGTDIYDIRIWFSFMRVSDEYEIVFQGFVMNLQDIIKAFELLGVDEKYLK
jgi:hypothetical protein